MSGGKPSKQQHNDAVNILGTTEFHYPTNANPRWKSFINEPKRTAGIEMGSESDPLYPDIVVIDMDRGRVINGRVGREAVVGIVEVETEASETVADQWEAYSALSQYLQIFVPKGLCDQARELAEEREIEVTRFWWWRFSNGLLQRQRCPE